MVKFTTNSKGSVAVLFFHHSPVNGKTAKVNTICEVRKLTEEGELSDIITEANALCGKKDNFSRKEGRRIALTRAVSKIDDRPFRKEIMDGYFTNRAYPGDF